MATANGGEALSLNRDRQTLDLGECATPAASCATKLHHCPLIDASKKGPVMSTCYPPARRRFLAASMGAATLVWMSASYAQSGPPPGAGGSVPGKLDQAVAPVDPQGVSCGEMKARLTGAGAMSIIAAAK